MKALELLKDYKNIDFGCNMDDLHSQIDEAIKELESLQAEYKNLNEYYWFARNHLQSYRCKCGSLGRVGYLCHNKECSEV